MKTINKIRRVAVAGAGAAFAACLLAAEPRPEPAKGRESVAELIAALNVSRGALVSLAVERFVLNEARGERWVMALVDGDFAVDKFTDGEFTIVALPADASFRGSGLTRFVTAYNQMALHEADTNALAGNLQYAEKAYRLILKCNPGATWNDAISRRLEIVAMAKTNVPPSALLDQLRRLDPAYEMTSFIANMGTAKATHVTNLLALELALPVLPNKQSLSPTPSSK